MSRRALYTIADNTSAFPQITVTGNFPAVGFIDWQGGNGVVYVIGGFGAGTATLQIQAPDGSTWVSLGAGVVFTSPGVGGFSAPAGRLRLNMAGAAGATALSWVVGIPTNNAG